jgi:hypothetical protein
VVGDSGGDEESSNLGAWGESDGGASSTSFESEVARESVEENLGLASQIMTKYNLSGVSETDFARLMGGEHRGAALVLLYQCQPAKAG